MNDYKNFFDYSIHGNKLVCYWSGINILRIETTEPIIEHKEYYQFKLPLFLNNCFSDIEIRKFNNNLLNEVGSYANVDISTLLNSDEFVFLGITKKPLASYNNRVGFQLKITCHRYEDTFNKMKNFLMYQLMISPIILEKVYNAAYCIFSDNHFVTFPFTVMGIGKYSEMDIPYVQLEITNNPDISSGYINQICKENALQNTLKIVKAMDLHINLYKMNDLIEFLYSRNAFLCFYGIDIHIDKIKKFKLYFRLKDIINVREALDIFSKKINVLDKVSIPYPDCIVDFIALTFIPKEKNEFVFDGIQIYQK